MAAGAYLLCGAQHFGRAQPHSGIRAHMGVATGQDVMHGGREREKHPGPGKTHTNTTAFRNSTGSCTSQTSKMSWRKMQTKPQVTSAICRVWIKKENEIQSTESSNDLLYIINI